jgi:hypothetical protein
MNHKHEALWPLKICTLCTLCTLIISNSLHLTIGSSLTLIQNELWVPKCCHANSKVFFLMFKVSKKCYQDFNLLHTYYTYYTSLFWVKSGSPVVCFHPSETFLGSLGFFKNCWLIWKINNSVCWLMFKFDLHP